MSDGEETKLPYDEIVRMAAEIVSAFVSHNALPADQVPDAIRSVYGALQDAQSGGGGHDAPLPAVAIRKSITPDYIVCLEDGKKLKMLKRHLMSTYGMTPEEYRAKWNLPADYPMVAPNYAQRRSEFAKQIGLGRKSAGRSRKRAGRKGA
jgi:predicted transcriptional regulator